MAKPRNTELRRGVRQDRAVPGYRFAGVAGVWLLALLTAPALWADRSQLKPPWNMFSPDMDIKVGRQNADLIKKRLPLCNDPKVDGYLTQLGLKLATKLPTRGVKYPWEFHCVNTKEINAFALPGGYVFVNRGLIEAADNEAQLAAVMGHELSHVALRHGTAQASKAQIAQGAAGIFSGLFGGSTGGSLLSQGVAAGAIGVLLHYSRADETQADVLGTQTIYDLGYDPRAMAQFFEKLEAESKGKNPPQFLSDHPNPGNRIARVDEEIDKLGGVPQNAKRDSPEFESVKREVVALPVVKDVPHPTSAASGPPPPPSRNFAEYRGKSVALRYPDNWAKYEDDNGITFAPEGGVMQGSGGQGQIAYGFIVSVNQVNLDTNDPNALETATQELIRSLQKSNPGIRVDRQAERITLSGRAALSTRMVNDSPAGAKENDWLVTVLQPGTLVSLLAVAPQSAPSEYDRTFRAMLDSVELGSQ